ncbi:hypothetical protein ACHAWF_011954 [Thalassiosira exigua]
MKSKVDIFRPLAAAASVRGPSAIFRRAHHHPSSSARPPERDGEASDSGAGRPAADVAPSGSTGDESFVCSVPPGEWPPHPAAASSGSDSARERRGQNRGLEIGAEVVGTSEDRSLTPQSQRGRRRDSSTVTTASGPSYYKIELVKEDGAEGTVRLAAGDDASVQFGPEHNEGLLVDRPRDDGDDEREKRGIPRAAPVGSLEADAADVSASTKRKKGERDAKQKWTISDGGKIVAIPPSPSPTRLSMSGLWGKMKSSKIAKASSTDAPSNASDSNSGSNLVRVEKGSKGEERDAVCPLPPTSSPLSQPPQLVKVDSHGSSGSESTVPPSPLVSKKAPLSAVMREEDRQVSNAVSVDEGSQGQLEAVSLESPPRMNRSVVSQSLFQESDGSDDGTSYRRKAARGDRRRSSSSKERDDPSTTNATEHSFLHRIPAAPSMDGSHPSWEGGSSARSQEGWFAQLLDVFSLGGGCCRQNFVAGEPVVARSCCSGQEVA